MEPIDKSTGPMVLKILAKALKDILPLNEITYVNIDQKQFSVKMFEDRISIVEVNHTSPNWTVDV